jgi:hypothetical protein
MHGSSLEELTPVGFAEMVGILKQGKVFSPVSTKEISHSCTKFPMILIKLSM